MKNICVYCSASNAVDKIYFDSAKEMGELIKGAKTLYLQKFVDREGVIQKGLHDISIEEANSFKDILSEAVTNVELRGY